MTCCLSAFLMLPTSLPLIADIQLSCEETAVAGCTMLSDMTGFSTLPI